MRDTEHDTERDTGRVHAPDARLVGTPVIGAPRPAESREEIAAAMTEDYGPAFARLADL